MLERYLRSMLCSACNGKGRLAGRKCQACGGTGASLKFDKLLRAATSGIRS